MARAGASDVYSASNDLLNAFLGIQIASSQVYRVTNLMGEQLTPDLRQQVHQPPVADQEVIYASMDGSMILTEEGWQEVKVGRVFSTQNLMPDGKKGDGQTRFRLSESQYSAHLGSHQDFTPQFEASLGSYKMTPERLVFVRDGAIWIQRYLEQTYPQATHILDYYHAVAHLSAFAQIHFASTPLANQWLANQRSTLLSDGLDGVLANLAALAKLSAPAQTSRSQLVAYCERNRDRMRYAHFQARELQIGSGPIEAAHRTVIQCGMKRSGQPWSEAGAQAMLNLWVVLKSDRWDLVRKNLTKS